MSVAEFMNICVSDPEYGYYTTKQQIFNVGGDFTTAPELGQFFGEVFALLNSKSLGVWIEVLLKQMLGVLKVPSTPISIIELGPGTGKLALDVLRSLFTIRKSLQGINMSFVDISDKLKTTQQQKLLNFLQSKNVYMNYKEIEVGPQKMDSFTSDGDFSMCWGRTLAQVMEHDLRRMESAKK
eukprot:TRINITY_DN3097_c0_g1_i1.p1 TRINITY_DN3097_c0_g1~~TRINITY_DN3097_c0_g1_i1.p1  ORF type:complete len:182 (-),score=47.38 TRINITY_DN3097_c0_g1_i1:883-1428(-)